MSTSPLHGPLADPSASSSSSVPPHSFQTSPGTSSTTHYRSQTISKPDGQGGASWEVSEHDGVLHVQGVPLATTESDMRELCEKRNISILSGIPSWSPRNCSEAGTANDGETAEVESAFPRHVAYVAFKCGSLRGQAFLELADPSQAPAAAALLNGMAIGSQRVVSVRVSSGTRRAKCMRAYANYLRGQHRVRLRGLRYEVVEADVREFLATAIGAEEASSPLVEVTLVRMGGETGPCSGDAFVRLRQAADVDLVLKLHGVKLGPRTVEVYESTEEDRQSIIRRSGRGDRGDGDNSHHGSVKSNRRNQHQNHHQSGGDGSQFKSNMVTPTPPMSFDSPRLSYSPGNKSNGGNHNNSVLLSPMQMLDGTQCWTPVPTVAAGGDASLYFPPVQYSVAGSSQLYPLSSGTLNNMVTANVPTAAMAPGSVQPLAMPFPHPGFFPSVGTASTSTTSNTPTAGMPQVVDWGTFNNANSTSISPSSNHNNNNSINTNNFNHTAMARSPFVLHVGCMPMGVTEAQVREHFRGVHIMPAGYHPFFLRYYNNSSYSLDAFIEVMSMEDVGAALLFNNRPMMESSLITVRCSSSQELMSTGLLNNNNTNAIMGNSSMNQNVMVGAASNAAAMVPQTQQQQQQQPLTFFLMPRVFA